MKSWWKLIALTGGLSLAFAMDATSQITNSLNFETSFPFYAGNAKMPAGSYRVSPVQSSSDLLLLEDANGSHSAFLEVTPTTSETPHAQSDVTFNKYGQVDFINLLWVQGQNYGMQVSSSKAEQNAAKAGAPVHHSVAIKTGG